MRVWLRWTLAGWCTFATLVILWAWFDWNSQLAPVLADIGMVPGVVTISACLVRLDSGRWPK